MKRIQTKITLVVLLTALVVGVVNMGIGMFLTRSSTTTAIEMSLLEMAEIAAASAQNAIAAYTAPLKECASNVILADAGVSADAKQSFLDQQAQANGMTSVGLADRSGYDSYHKVDVSKEPYFQYALDGQVYMSSPYTSDNGKTAYLIVSVPVVKGDTVIGVIYFQDDTEILQSIVENIAVGESGTAYILDKDGTTIAYQDFQQVLDHVNSMADAQADPTDKDLQDLARIERMMVDGQTGVEQYYYSQEDFNSIQGFAPISGTDGWSVAVTANADEFMRTANIGNIIQAVLFLVTFAAAALLSVLIGRSIARPIAACSERLRKLSDGDLQSPVPEIKSKDEVRALADSTADLVRCFRKIMEEFGTALSRIANGDLTQGDTDDRYPGDFAALQDYLNLINDKLNYTMSEIVSAAGKVARGSEVMSSTSNVLSQGAMEQASALEELSAAIVEIDHEARHTEELADQAKASALGAGDRMEESSQYIANLNDAMASITESSNEIVKVLATIENIAFQTNILALNAAVEAARAGTAGKGFAVVADEVRNLATKSDQAAKATQELIEHSVASVAEGSQVVAKVVQSMSEVRELTGEAVSKMEVVATAVENQTQSITQITAGVDQISGVVQTNSASSEESAAASQRLAGQAEALKSLVSGFTLRQQPSDDEEN